MKPTEIAVSKVIEQAELFKHKKFVEAAKKVRELIENDKPCWIYWANGTEVLVSDKPLQTQEEVNQQFQTQSERL